MSVSRLYVCRTCKHERAAETRTGPLPSVCDVCDPDRARKRDRARVAVRQTAQHVRADARLGRELLTRSERVGAPDAPTLARAVRDTIGADGKVGKREALLNLAAVAVAWAECLR